MGLFSKAFNVPVRKIRNYSTFLKFSDYLSLRRQQAEKSILIQVVGPESSSDLKSYLTSEFGPIESFFAYNLSGKGKGSSSSSSSSRASEVYWVLTEFSSKEHINQVNKFGRYSEGTIPYNSSVLWYNQNLTKRKKGTNINPNIGFENFGSSNNINFSNSKDLSSQIELLEQSLKLTELGIRVRFLIANKLEMAFTSIFPGGCVLPFGSSVSGIGRQSGDLDLVLVPDKVEIFPDISQIKENSRLWHQAKSSPNGNVLSSRFQVQRVMETMADILQLFIPGCNHVQRILQARVPILRFWSEYTDLQCDLSMTNSSGVHMSELIYLMCSIENRFPLLLCAIRSWASAKKITNPFPGRQPTNFMLVLLSIYFLQSKKILPTFDVLFNNPSNTDKRVTIDGIDCTFQRDPKIISQFFTPQNSDLSIGDLFLEFFEFYSEFDFVSKGISLFTGSSIGKPDSGAFYIQNPLERHLNVARNVSKEEVSRFKSECCSTLWTLETTQNKKDIGLKELFASSQFSKPLDYSFKIKEFLKE